MTVAHQKKPCPLRLLLHTCWAPRSGREPPEHVEYGILRTLVRSYQYPSLSEASTGSPRPSTAATRPGRNALAAGIAVVVKLALEIRLCAGTVAAHRVRLDDLLAHVAVGSSLTSVVRRLSSEETLLGPLLARRPQLKVVHLGFATLSTHLRDCSPEKSR